MKSNYPAIIAQNLTKRFGDFTAVNDVNFEVNPGEIFGFHLLNVILRKIP